MDTKKMLDKLEDCVFAYAVITMTILFGALTFFSSLEANIMAMVGISCLLVALIGFKIFEAKCYAKIKAKEDMQKQAKLYTIMLSDGSYGMDINDLYGAVQKLGYLEHREELS